MRAKKVRRWPSGIRIRTTLEVLDEMLPEAERQGLRLVFASDLAR